MKRSSRDGPFDRLVVLLVLPKIGSVRAGRILAQCGIAHSKMLVGLTDRQRGELINLFRR